MAPNPRLVALCIALFLASCLITFTVQSSRHNGTWLPPIVPGSKAPQGRLQRPVNAAKVAYATFLGGNTMAGAPMTDEDSEAADDQDDGYYLGTRVLAYQLLHSQSAGTNNSIPFIVMCTEDVSKRKRDRLKKDGATIVVVKKLESDWVNPAVERWKDVLAKLRLFQLTEYNKILFIDADTLVTASLDGVFYDESTLMQATLANPEHIKEDEAAMPRTYMFATHGDYFGYDHPYPPDQNLDYLNCGFFVFTPSKVLFEYYLSLLKLPGRFDPGFPEQNLLNYAHRRDGNMPWKPLWYGWNVNWPTEKDWRDGARSFHAKYWDGDPSHDPLLKAIWKEQKAEMEGFYRGRDIALGR
ncbi:hypothetical protein NU195Hw_g4718t1 [Hortaea werneckii]